MNLLRIYRKLTPWPLGRRIFSFLVSIYAPYFYTIRPRVISLDERHVQIALKKRWAVQNHIGTVHAIAMCNLCEMCGGLLMEAGLPPSKRWIPKGMNVSYLAKANSDLIGICEHPGLATTPNGDCILTVSIRDKDQKEVVRADITMWVSDRKTT